MGRCRKQIPLEIQPVELIDGMDDYQVRIKIQHSVYLPRQKLCCKQAVIGLLREALQNGCICKHCMRNLNVHKLTSIHRHMLLEIAKILPR